MIALQRTPGIKIAICGHGTCGKDTAGEILRDHTIMRYTAGTSMFAADLVFEMWGKDHYPTVHACWLDRHNHRPKWADLIGEYNRLDPVALYRRCLEDQDMLTGLRWQREIQPVKQAGLVDLWIWIERDVPPDPTQQYGPEECDIIVDNNGTVADLTRKLRAMAKTWGVLRD